MMRACFCDGEPGVFICWVETDKTDYGPTYSVQVHGLIRFDATPDQLEIVPIEMVRFAENPEILDREKMIHD